MRKKAVPSSVVRETSFVSRPQKRAYGIERIAYGQKSGVGVRTLSYTPPAIRSDPDEIRFTIHASRVSRTPLADFFNILLVALPRYQMDRTRLDRGHHGNAG